jgi:hypothetical protein
LSILSSLLALTFWTYTVLNEVVKYKLSFNSLLGVTYQWAKKTKNATYRAHLV